MASNIIVTSCFHAAVLMGLASSASAANDLFEARVPQMARIAHVRATHSPGVLYQPAQPRHRLTNPAGPAGVVQYQMTVLTIPGAESVLVSDINDAGTIVGSYIAGQQFHPYIWDETGPHDLAVPDQLSTFAFSINNDGQIIGAAQSATETLLLRWSSLNPSVYEILLDSSIVAVIPAHIDEDGVVVGAQAPYPDGNPTHASVYTQEAGVIDYGSTDSGNPSLQALLRSSDASGNLVGAWSDNDDASGNTHAAIGHLGTPGISGLSAATDAVNSGITATNANGLFAGYMDISGDGRTVPVSFTLDGTPTALNGADFGGTFAQANDVNDSGTIIGVAETDIGNTLFAYRNGTAQDLFAITEDTNGLLAVTAQAINNRSLIVGEGLDSATFALRSFVLAPIFGDAVFSDGFDSTP